MLTLERLRQVNIPLNVSNKPNNLSDYEKGVAVYNDSVNLFEALELYFGGSSASGTDLTNTPSATTVVINSSTGLDTVLAAATTTLAGVMTATDKVNLNNLITLTGVPAGSLNLGSFTGNILSNNISIKTALQQLETYIEAIPVILKGNLSSNTQAIIVTNGINSVIGSGTTLTLDSTKINISTLAGTLNLNQINSGGAINGQILVFNGTNWAATTYTPDIPLHNDLLGKQGGTTGEYYHIPLTIYNKLVTPISNSLLGRSATSGEIQHITPIASVEIVGTNISLTNDLLIPGNSMYYGTNASGIKGWYSNSVFTGVTEIFVSDSADIDLSIINPTTTPTIEANLTNSGVISGTYGSPVTVPQITVDLKGRITSAINTSISLTSSNISDFEEAVDDRVNDLLVAGSGIAITYDDLANTITIANSAVSSGVANRVAWWLDSDTLTTSDNLKFDGDYLTVGNPVAISISRLSTRGTSNGLGTFGYVHLNSTNNEVFKVADNGAITIGALGDVYIHPDQMNISAGGTYTISKSGGNLGLYSDTTVVVEGGGTATNTPSFKSVATRSTNIGAVYNAQVQGTFNMTAGSNRYSDLYIDTQVNQSGGTSPIRSIYINPTITAATNYSAIEINAPGHHALRTTAGNVRFDFGSDATGDIYYRDANGNLARLPIGGPTEVLGSNGTIPAWTTTAGSLPGGSAGAFLIYSGGSWVSGTYLREKQTGITGTNVNLASTPLADTPVQLYKNGILQELGDDYTILGTTITMVESLLTTDKISAIYYI